MTPDILISEIERQIGAVQAGGGQPVAVELGEAEYELLRDRIQDGQLELTEEIQASTSTELRHLGTFRLPVDPVARPNHLQIATRPTSEGDARRPVDDIPRDKE